ncbi:MAG: ATP-binding cassette domain-containing protein [Nitrospinae bacterium]|nr:ATP-binding cassette domain-containing protein [Nitrospinota bacterium]
MINVSNLTKQFGHKILFENITIAFHPGKRYGLIGANGSGKSTLLKIISGEETASSGDVTIHKDIKVGTLLQDHFRFEDTRILDVVLMGKPELWKAMEEKEKLLEKDSHDEVTGHRLAELEDIVAHHDGYNAESFAAELLCGLGIAVELHNQKLKVLPGGFKLRALLAQALFKEPGLLLLDEPTNHLDILSICWLENFLKNNFKGTLLLVSHDHDFINGVCTNIADVDYETVTMYTGNYDQFIAAKELAMEQRERELGSQEKKKAEMQAFVDRFKAKATKARQAQSRQKQIDKMEEVVIKKSSRIFPNFRFEPLRPTGKRVLHVDNLAKSFKEKKVLTNVNLTVMRGEKVAIIGPNGIGKSTLLKIVLGEIEADAGEYEWGHEIIRSYFAQDHKELFKKNTDVYNWLHDIFPDETIGSIRGMLGKVLFSGDDVKKSVKSISGGESARLMLAKIMFEKGNVLILDEPTNHLDIEGIEALGKALKAYKGTILLVSHDRHFVSRIATRVLELHPEGMTDFSGSYQEYLESAGFDHLDRSNSPIKEKEKKEEKPSQNNLSYNEKKELKKKINQCKNKNRDLEKEIEKVEKELEKIDKLFCEKGFYEKKSRQEIDALNKKRAELQSVLEKTMNEWEKGVSALEKMEKAIA